MKKKNKINVFNSSSTRRTTREQYWACKDLTSREKTLCTIIFLLTLIILSLLSVIVYMHFRQSDKNLSQMFPSWIQDLSVKR